MTLKLRWPRHPLVGGLLLLLLCAPFFLYRLGAPGLSDPDEGRNAEVAREMLDEGSWITPLFNGAPYLDKPPAFFWLVALSYRVFGVNELAARLPAALCALAGILLTAWFARRHLDPIAGRIAGLVLALSPLYIVFGRTVIFDMPLTLCMTASAMAAYEAMEGDRRSGRRAAPILFAAAGLGTLIKGPIALLGPLLIAAAWAIARGRPSLLKRLRWGWGIAIYAAVVLPWLFLIASRHSGYLEYALISENLQRIATDELDRAAPFHFYWKVLLPGFFPWVLLVIGAALRRVAALRGAALRWAAALRRAPTTRARLVDWLRTSDPRLRFLLYGSIWIAVLVLFFSSIASKRPGYVLPCAAPIALIVAALWTSPSGHRDAARADVFVGSWLVAPACWILGAAFALGGPGGLARGLSRGRYDALLSRDLLFGGTAAALIVAGFLVLLLRGGRRPILSLASMALIIVVMIPMARAVLGFVDEARSARTVSRFLESRMGPEDRIICYEDYRPGLNFYLRREIDQVTPDGRVFTSNYIERKLDRFAGDPSFRLMPEGRMRELFARRDPEIFLLTPRRHYDELPEVTGVPVRRIYEDDFGGVFVRDDETVRPGSP
jgi:4-amino-4-deoxy-L-arabinose transferase-like glycosyltransferase